jgi:hypothetical protein
MITEPAGVRVLVVGPHDLVTTSMVAALQTHGLRVQEWGGETARVWLRHRQLSRA